MNIDNIPADLRRLNQWTVYKSYLDETSGRHAKEIIDPKTGRFAKCNDPATWEEFYRAEHYRKRNKHKGLAFALNEGIVFIDLDHAIDRESGAVISPEAVRLLELLPDTYAERSVSGTGIHILCYGTLPEDAKRRNDLKGIEIYDARRFVCMTGDVIGDRRNLADYSDRIAEIAYEFTGRRVPKREYAFVPSAVEDSDLIEQIRRSRQGAKFDRLCRGNISGYPSHSNADSALAFLLAWWTRDESQIDRIFRSSGLMRDKWDSPRGGSTYGDQLIADALSRVSPRVIRTGKKKEYIM